MTVTDRREPELARLAGGAALSVVGGVVTGASALALVTLVAWVLGPAAAGVFGIGVAVSTIATQAGKLGCDTALVHFVPRWVTDADAPDLRGVLLRVLSAVGALGVLAGLLAWWAAPTLADLLLEGAVHRSGTAAMRAVAISLPPAAVAAVALAATRGYGVVRPLVLNDQVAKPLLRLGLVGVALAAGAGVEGALLGWAVAQWAVLPSALRALHRLAASPAAAGARPERAVPLAAGFWRFARLRLLSATVEVVGLHAGLLVVGAALGTTEAGIYAVATRLVLAGHLTLQAVRLAVAPHLSAALAEGDTDRAEDLHRASSAWVVLTAWPVHLVLLLASPTVLAILGPGFEAGWPVLSIVAVAGLVGVGAGNVQTVLLMGGHAGRYLAVAVTSVTVNLLALVSLVPLAGAEGAALALVLAAVAENGLTIVLVRRHLGVRHFGRPVVTAALVTTGTVGAGALLVRLLDLGPAEALGVLVAAAGCQLGLCWRLRSAMCLENVLSTVRKRS